MIGEVSEEWQNLINGSSQSSSLGLAPVVSPSLSQPQDMSYPELPAFGSLQLIDNRTQMTQNISKTSSYPSSGQDLPSNADAKCIEMDWIQETGTKASESEAECNSYRDENLQDSLLSEAKHLHFLGSTEYIPKCQGLNPTSNGQLKRPSKPLQSSGHMNSDKSKSNRKRRLIFDIDEDEGTQISEVQLNEEVDDQSVSFTPINRRQSVILGETQGKDGEYIVNKIHGKRLHAPHNGRLISKRDNTFASNFFSDTDRRVYSNNITDEDNANPTQSDAENDNINKLPKNIRRRWSTEYDYEEAAIYNEASKDNRLFRTARSFGESVARKRLEKMSQNQQAVLSADSTSSIKTAATLS